MRIPILMIIFCALPLVAAAELYSCRDSEGRLHVTDNLLALPDECRADVREEETSDPDNLPVVPEPAASPVVDSRSRVELEMLEQERRRQEQQQREDQLIREARGLADTYVQAQQDRRNAIRSWSPDSRRTIARAADEMAAARSGKQRMLADLERQRLPIRTSEQIRAILETIPAP